jgi:hypothetical protein
MAQLAIKGATKRENNALLLDGVSEISLSIFIKITGISLNEDKVFVSVFNNETNTSFEDAVSLCYFSDDIKQQIIDTMYLKALELADKM